jgi:hypothetical protein
VHCSDFEECAASIYRTELGSGGCGNDWEKVPTNIQDHCENYGKSGLWKGERRWALDRYKKQRTI